MHTRPLEVAIARDVTVGLSDAHIRQILRLAHRTVGKTITSISVAFVSTKTIHQLNKQYRKKDAPTDVLSFCYDHEGEIVVSPEMTMRFWKNAGKGRREALAFVLVHGFLHIAGYDHQNRRAEKTMLGLNESLVADAKRQHYV